MYAVPSISGLMTSNKRQQRNNKTTTTAATNQSIKPKKKKQRNKQKKYNIKRGFVTGKSHEEKSFTSYKFSLIQLLIPGPVPAAMPSDMETTTAGRPVDSKFEVTTESNDNDV